MSQVIAFGLPASTATSAPSSRNVGPNDLQRRGAWLREMENAQMGEWLKQPILGPSPAKNLAVQLNKSEVPLGLKTAPLVETRTPFPKVQPKAFCVVPSSPLKLPLQCEPQNICTTQPSSLQWGGAARLDARIFSTGDSVLQAVASLQSSPLCAAGEDVSPAAITAPRTPIRVHVQESSEGLHLWMGLDASEQGNIQTIVAGILARLDGLGTRLARLVCNGRIIYEAPCVGDSQNSQSPPTQPSYNQESLWP